MKRETVKLQAPITYYGGKRRLVSQILPLIPRHRIYCEPFFGGGTIFFNKQPSYLEVINDINDNLITFYRVIQKRYQNLKEMIDDTLYSESVYKKAKQVYFSSDKVDELERAFAVFVVFNMSINSCPECNWSFDNGTGGSHSGILFSHKKDSFCPWLKERMKYVQISCRDALKVIKERDSLNTFFYLDPPYPNSNQGHYKGYSTDDLVSLLELLQNIHGQFILSNYPSDVIDFYTRKNNWLLKELEVKQYIVNQCAPGRKKREILLMNFLPVQDRYLSIF